MLVSGVDRFLWLFRGCFWSPRFLLACVVVLWLFLVPSVVAGLCCCFWFPRLLLARVSLSGGYFWFLRFSLACVVLSTSISTIYICMEGLLIVHIIQDTSALKEHMGDLEFEKEMARATSLPSDCRGPMPPCPDVTSRALNPDFRNQKWRSGSARFANPGGKRKEEYALWAYWQRHEFFHPKSETGFEGFRSANLYRFRMDAVTTATLCQRCRPLLAWEAQRGIHNTFHD